MKRALKLAERGRGYTSPNPMVGAVVVADGDIVGEGYHEKHGAAHAEVKALDAAGDKAAGATLYVTLEPCAHQGKTGPCTHRIFDSGISRVVIGMRDPNPLVDGKGIKYLKSKGISVTEDVLAGECAELNQGYIKVITTGIPFISLKIAQTLDGRIATSTGHSKWITSDEARTLAHKIRARYDAILVGIGTILTDDPSLTVRRVKGVSPRRVILDSKCRTPLDAGVLNDDMTENTILITTDAASREKISRVEDKGVTVVTLAPDDRGWVPQKALFEALGELGLTSILVEGGSAVHTECLKNGFADKVYLFLAPKILGSGIDAIGDLKIRNINSALNLTDITLTRVGPDLLLSGTLRREYSSE